MKTRMILFVMFFFFHPFPSVVFEKSSRRKTKARKEKIVKNRSNAECWIKRRPFLWNSGVRREICVGRYFWCPPMYISGVGRYNYEAKTHSWQYMIYKSPPTTTPTPTFLRFHLGAAKNTLCFSPSVRENGKNCFGVWLLMRAFACAQCSLACVYVGHCAGEKEAEKCMEIKKRQETMTMGVHKTDGRTDRRTWLLI